MVRVSLPAPCLVTVTRASAFPLEPLTVNTEAARAPLPMLTSPEVAAVMGPTQRVVTLVVTVVPIVVVTVVTSSRNRP